MKNPLQNNNKNNFYQETSSINQNNNYNNLFQTHNFYLKNNNNTNKNNFQNENQYFNITKNTNKDILNYIEEHNQNYNYEYHFNSNNHLFDINSEIKNNISNQNYFFNNNLIEKNDKKINIENNYQNKLKLNEKKENENKGKKYIFMSELLSKAPKRLNPKIGKPFILNNKREKNKILNIKIKIPNQKDEIIFSFNKNDNPIQKIKELIPNENENLIPIIIKQIYQCLNYLNLFNSYELNLESQNIIHVISNCINN